MILAALLLASSASAALAPQFQCVKKRRDGGFDEPESFQDLMDCQARMATASGVSGNAMDAFQEQQRAEARSFLSRHTVGPDDEPRLTGKAGADDGEDGDGAGAKAAADALAKDMDKEAGAIDPKTLEALAGLRAVLKIESDDGKLGVTPQMRDQIMDFLAHVQDNGISPEFKDLLFSAASEGPNLSKATVAKLAKAADAAKAAGLDTGVDKKTQQALDQAKDPATPDPTAKQPPKPATN